MTTSQGVNFLICNKLPIKSRLTLNENKLVMEDYIFNNFVESQYDEFGYNLMNETQTSAVIKLINLRETSDFEDKIREMRPYPKKKRGYQNKAKR